MPRFLLSDELWSKLREILLQLAVYDKRDLRLTVEGILYRMRTACPWRDLPESFGAWNKVYKRFNAWSTSQYMAKGI
jgi:transposase